MNFVGSGVTATTSGNAVTVTIPGGSGSGTSGTSGTSGLDGNMNDNIAINVVPASKDLTNWYPTNEWRDAFVVIPDALHGMQLAELRASFGDQWQGDDSEWHIEMRNSTNATVSSYQYIHPGSQREYFENMSGTPIFLQKGYTLNIRFRSGGVWSHDPAKGYTVTLTVTP